MAIAYVRDEIKTEFGEQLKRLVADRHLVLASVSPRRAQILTELGLACTIQPSAVEEQDFITTDPAERALQLSYLKVAAVKPSFPDSLILGADTFVVLNGQILGKPRDHQEAFDMLSRLTARWHEVYTGVTITDRRTEQFRSGIECTKVKFRHLTTRAIYEYISSGEPFDKAGAYGIQGLGGALVEQIEGCFENVIGLPVRRLVLVLQDLLETARAIDVQQLPKTDPKTLFFEPQETN